MKIFLLNAGSSSLKCFLVESSSGVVLARGQADWAGERSRYQYFASDGGQPGPQVDCRGYGEAVRRFVADLANGRPTARYDPFDVRAVGHRIVHGGEFTASVRITAKIRGQLEALADLAPLHNPPSLETLAAAEREFPDTPQVAVFDTAFHATMPPAARTYAVPEKWERDWNIRRFGFHGLSHSYCARRAAEMMPSAAGDLRLVICHLGHGCSASAVHGGRSVDTTMGFTPLDGLMMATRSGSIDPGIVMHVQRHYGLSVESVERVLNRESGLLGVSGVSADMREVLAAARQGHSRANLAVEIYTRRVRQAIGGLAVTMGGVDALVFTGGVGQNASLIRAAVCQNLKCLGVELSPEANENCQPDMDIAAPNSTCRILVIATREELTMMHEVLGVLEESSND
jgi:acetate kinase